MYPLVGWKVNNITTYIIEGRSNSTTAALEWAKLIDLFKFVQDSSEIAENIVPEASLSFINALNDGLQTPYDDSNACAGFVGLKPTTNKAQMLRAILESIAFSTYQIWESMRDEYSIQEKIHVIRFFFFLIINFLCRCCGGVSNNNFICQQLANLFQMPIERVSDSCLSSAKGACLLAGISAGIIICIFIKDIKKFKVFGIWMRRRILNIKLIVNFYLLKI